MAITTTASGTALITGGEMIILRILVHMGQRR
jgi:hypothetical protein